MSIDPVDGSATIGFLGPSGTFTEQALRSQPDLAGAKLRPCESFSDVLFAVAEGELDLGFVAVENAIEGTVNISMDTLAFDVDLRIQREVILPVEMNLLVSPGVTLDQVRRVASFPHAYAQCRGWLRANLPGVELVAANSTAGAAAMLADRADPGLAAIANRRAAEVYGLDVLASDIEDHPGNATRFMLVGREGIPGPTGHDKTSIVVFQRADAPAPCLPSCRSSRRDGSTCRCWCRGRPRPPSATTAFCSSSTDTSPTRWLPTAFGRCARNTT